MHHKVSIVIPVYNVECYIGNCLQSVLNQTFKDFEIIIVDDRGNDNSMAVAKDILSSQASSVDYQIIQHKCNRGLSAARNSGLAASSSEYVYFLDSDDTITPLCLELLVNKADKSKSDMVIGNISVIGDDTNIPRLNTRNADDDGIIEGKDLILESYIHQDFYVMAWNKLLRTSFLKGNDISFVEGLVHEDNPWTLLVTCTAQKIAFVEKDTYNYLVRENSLQTCKNFDVHFNAYLQIIKEYQSIAEKYITQFTPKSQKLLAYWIDRQKALFFSMTERHGTVSQQKAIYHLIHSCMPNGKFTKEDMHYLLPESLGYLCYKHFYGYKLM